MPCQSEFLKVLAADKEAGYVRRPGVKNLHVGGLTAGRPPACNRKREAKLNWAKEIQAKKDKERWVDRNRLYPRVP